MAQVRRFHRPSQGLPEGQLSLTHIDQLVDNASSHKLLSFMDAFSDYNQSHMFSPDQEKTYFITDEGTFCHKMMPFSLRNAGVTYQVVLKLDGAKHRGLCRWYACQIYDRPCPHRRLHEIFVVLRQYQIWFNLEKCVFRVTSRKFLIFMVTNRRSRWIQTDHYDRDESRQTIMTILTKAHDLQVLNGRIATLKKTERALSFFKQLRGLKTKGEDGRKTIQWTKECQ